MKVVVKFLFKILWLLIVPLACSSNITYHSKTKNFNQPLNIFIDKKFTFEEQMIITKAFHAWEVASSYVAKFNIHYSTPRPHLYKVENSPRPEPNTGVFVWQVDPYDNSDKSFADNLKKEYQDKQWLGLHIPGKKSNEKDSYIFLFMRYKAEDKEKFYGVILHEIGHLLGLRHDEDNENALMHPTKGPPCITKYEAYRLCKLYDCTPKQDCKPSPD